MWRGLHNESPCSISFLRPRAICSMHSFNMLPHICKPSTFLPQGCWSSNRNDRWSRLGLCNLATLGHSLSLWEEFINPRCYLELRTALGREERVQKNLGWETDLVIFDRAHIIWDTENKVLQHSSNPTSTSPRHLWRGENFHIQINFICPCKKKYKRLKWQCLHPPVWKRKSNKRDTKGPHRNPATERQTVSKSYCLEWRCLFPLTQ